ncbi:MAG TPA: hypothetical protein VF258_00380, partial [Luteolibacter sp.]
WETVKWFPKSGVPDHLHILQSLIFSWISCKFTMYCPDHDAPLQTPVAIIGPSFDRTGRNFIARLRKARHH